MSFFKRLKKMMSNAPSDDPGYYFTVTCSRCGEQIRGRVNTRNDLSLSVGEDSEAPAVYFCRKTLVGDQLCFQRVEVELTFDASRNLIDRKIQGGKFADEELPAGNS